MGRKNPLHTVELLVTFFLILFSNLCLGFPKLFLFLRILYQNLVRICKLSHAYRTVTYRTVTYLTLPNLAYRNLTYRTVGYRAEPYRNLLYRTLIYPTVP